MTIFSFARSLLSPVAYLSHKLFPRRRPAPFAPVTFAEMEQRKKEVFGEHVDRTPCSCPHCRRRRKSAG